MREPQNEHVGFFSITYEIRTEGYGAPLFRVHLGVNTPAKKITGLGHISQAINPPLSIDTKLDGDYTYMCVMPRNCHILITATGYPIVDWPIDGGIGPVLLPNVKLRMVVSEDWQSGTANYSYTDNTGKTVDMTDVPVRAIYANTITGANSHQIKSL